MRFSLSTADPVVANERSAIANAYLRRLFQELRRGPQTLSQKQVVALSGDVYRLVVEKFDENPGTPDRWAAFKALSRAAQEGRLVSPPKVTTEVFFDERRLRSKTTENPGKGRLNSLRRFLHDIGGVAIGRQHGKDPNHAWRHWLKGKLREAGVPDSVSDGITGHAPGTEGAAYGGVSLKAMADALAKLTVPKPPGAREGSAEDFAAPIAAE